MSPTSWSLFVRKHITPFYHVLLRHNSTITRMMLCTTREIRHKELSQQNDSCSVHAVPYLHHLPAGPVAGPILFLHTVKPLTNLCLSIGRIRMKSKERSREVLRRSSIGPLSLTYGSLRGSYLIDCLSSYLRDIKRDLQALSIDMLSICHLSFLLVQIPSMSQQTQPPFISF